MRHSYKTVLFCGALVLALGLFTGCDKTHSSQGQGSVQGQAANQKDVAFQNYVVAYNKFLEPMGGLETSLNNFLKDQTPAPVIAKNGDIPPMTIVAFNYVSLGVDALQEGVQSSNAQNGAVDATAKALLEKVQALQVKAKEFNAYYTSKKYTEDNWAKDKAEKDALIQLWKDTIALNHQFGQQISAVNDEKRTKEADALKAKGQVLQADTLLAISKSKEILGMLKSNDKLSDFSATDSKVAELESILAEHEKAEQQAKIDKKLDNDFYQKFRENLNQMIGQYRALKSAPASAKAKAFNSMVDAYNEAVFYKNQM
jgi:hypothetical protein